MKSNQTQTWIFLRGLSREAAHWGSFPKDFEKRFGCDVVVLDLPGTGEHYTDKSPLSLQAIVECVRKDWKSRNPGRNRPAFVFALSLGAMVALQWMQQYPGEIAGAVLVNTSLRGFSPFFERLSLGAYGKLARIFLERNLKMRERHILELTSQQREWDDAELKARVEIQKKRPVKRLTAFRQIMAALSLSPPQRPVQPVLLLNSLGDMLVHPDCSTAIAHDWKVPLRRHAWAGHDLPLDDPKWTLESTFEWLESLPRPTSTKPAKSK